MASISGRMSDAEGIDFSVGTTHGKSRVGRFHPGTDHVSNRTSDRRHRRRPRSPLRSPEPSEQWSIERPRSLVANHKSSNPGLPTPHQKTTDWSPVNDNTFHRVFGLFGPAVFASMTAYLTAQFIDIRIFHFWKRKTKNRHLWLRNNGSTIFSQLIDTMSVLFLLCSFGVIEWVRFYPLLLNGFIFKVLVALIDTPFFYLFSHLLRKLFHLKLGEEVQL